MPLYTVVLDACVLVPITLADTLLRIAERGLYQPLWSEEILAEAQQAVEEIHPGIDVTKRLTDMREAFEEALVADFEALEPGIHLPDPDDRHVVAAALQGGAHAIVTANLADFPSSELSRLGLSAISPDDFLLDQIDGSPPTVMQVICEQAAHAKNPPLSPPDLATRLRLAGVPKFADEILRLMSSPLDGI